MITTLKDLARHLNVSVTQVSRALGGFPDVSAKTRARVEQAAHELGYFPNFAARRLKQQRAETVGLLLPHSGTGVSDPFFGEMMASIGSEATRLGYDLLLSTAAPGPEEMAVYERIVKGRRVDGLLLIRPREQDERIRFLAEQRFPFVAFGGSAPAPDYAWVGIDSYQGFRTAADHLFELGHRRIAFISATLDLSSAAPLLSAYRDALQAHRAVFEEDLIAFGDLTYAGGYRAALQLIGSPPRPSAIMAANDLMAMGAISAIQQRAWGVGHEIAVVGYDGTPMAEYTHPPLTTVCQPIFQAACQAMRMLAQLIQGERPDPLQVLLPPSLIVRESSLPKSRPVEPEPVANLENQSHVQPCRVV
jgi:LacI family transcriptional regulator